MGKILERIKYFLFHVQDDWEIGLIKSSIGNVITSKSLPHAQWLDMPQNVFWADPFGVQLGDKYYVYYEELAKEKAYGTINCMVLNEQFEIEHNQVIIDEGLHFSFPHLFEVNGQWYMLPESLAKGKLSIYRCENFPFVWKEEKVILDFPVADSIIYQEGESWYLLYSKSNEAHNLYLRKNDRFDGGWENQEEIKISTDPKLARNGGELAKVGGELYRISQDCSGLYGERIGVNRVISHNPSNYKEELINEFSMKEGRVTCCHTLNSCGDITLIDRRRERLFFKSIPEMFKQLFRKLKS